MAAAVRLRGDFSASRLRELAKGSRCPDQTRRLPALAEIYDGRSRSEAARLGGVGLQMPRDWVLRFTVDGPDGPLNGKAPGNAAILDAAQRRVLAQWVFEEFGLSIGKQTLSREPRATGFRKLTARPRPRPGWGRPGGV